MPGAIAEGRGEGQQPSSGPILSFSHREKGLKAGLGVRTIYRSS